MRNEIEMVQPFDSFRILYKVLVWLGYSKPINNPKSKIKIILHQLYRPFAFLIVFVYNVQHITFVFLSTDDVEILFDGVMIAIPHLNLLMKVIALNYGSSRLEKLRELLKGPIFQAKNKRDEEYLKENTKYMNRLIKFANIGLTFCAIIWMLTPFAKRMKDENTPVTTYVPFETKTWKGFSLGMFVETFPVFWIGYGHISLDLLISAYYLQARVQLKIIKHNLEHLCDCTEVNEEEGNNNNRNIQYIDIVDMNIQERFVHYIQRYEKVAWYTEEINSVFNVAISSQLYTTSAAICLVIYKMSMTNTMSMLFMYFVIYFFILQVQVFVYCYYGGLVDYESMSVASAMYLGDWVTLSPRFRRQLSIAMARWSRPISPQVSAIIPLSLNTFISIVRAAYTLFTVLKSSQNL